MSQFGCSAMATWRPEFSSPCRVSLSRWAKCLVSVLLLILELNVVCVATNLAAFQMFHSFPFKSFRPDTPLRLTNANSRFHVERTSAWGVHCRSPAKLLRGHKDSFVRKADEMQGPFRGAFACRMTEHADTPAASDAEGRTASGVQQLEQLLEWGAEQGIWFPGTQLVRERRSQVGRAGRASGHGQPNKSA
jgi:hypothetical protein